MNSARTTFDEIDVHRINIFEPDGTLRNVLLDKSRFPGIILKGKEYTEERKLQASCLN